MQATLRKRDRYRDEPGEDRIQIDNVINVEISLGSPDLTGLWTGYGYHMATITAEGIDGQQSYNLEVYHMIIS